MERRRRGEMVRRSGEGEEDDMEKGKMMNRRRNDMKMKGGNGMTH